MSKKKETLLGMSVKKEEDFSRWYQEICLKGELIDYTDIGGCFVLRPWSYAIWEFIVAHMDSRFKKLGVKNTMFPIFVSKSALEAEESHISDFAPEVAWVTRAGNSDLAEPIAIRPTSETVMYPVMKNWIRSHRDLPVKINQWCSVVRWEFSQTMPFIRSREFLWQEGHTMYGDKSAAETEVTDILDIYENTYEHVLAVPVVKGRKSEKEKFAGGDYTTTCEAFIPSVGRGIQACTSHHLGQNFAKMFDITYDDEKLEQQLVFQNSWGFTTRSIGVALMIHGDDKGIVLPPRAAPLQTVVVPLIFKKRAAEVTSKAAEIHAGLLEAGYRSELDDRDAYKPGWKYNYWDLRGVPTHIEFGPRDMDKGCCVIARRDTGEKIFDVPLEELPARLGAILDEIHESMLSKARAEFHEHIVPVEEWSDFVPTLNGKNIVLAPWCEAVDCETSIKKRSSEDAIAIAEAAGGEGKTAAAKSLCIPFDQEALSRGKKLPPKCINCDAKATVWCMFGRSY